MQSSVTKVNILFILINSVTTANFDLKWTDLFYRERTVALNVFDSLKRINSVIRFGNLMHGLVVKLLMLAAFESLGLVPFRAQRW